MSNFIDRTGMRWGKLVAKEYLGDKKWLCQCDCGNETIVTTDHLPMNPNRRGTKSCGCLLTNRKITNYRYFENIDTCKKAYFLGLLAADGSVYTNNKTYELKLALKSSDIKILEEFKKELGFTGDIKIYSSVVIPPSKSKNPVQSEMAVLRFNSKDLILDLKKYNIIQNKTNVLDVDLSNIADEFIPDFFRGYWDGDGTFGMYDRSDGRHNYFVSIIGAEPMMKKTKEYLLKHCDSNLKINIWKAKGCNEHIFRLGTSRKQDFKTLLDFLYKDSTIFLERKYNKYIDCMKHFSTTIKNSIDYPIGDEISQQE